MQAVQRKWNLARLRYRKQLQREFWIRRNELGIALACPQIRGSNGVSRGGSRGPPQVRWGPAPLPAKPKKMRTLGASQVSILLLIFPRGNERKQ